MGRFIGKRLLQLIPILLGITVLTFALMQMASGDAVDAMIETSGIAVTPEVEAHMRSELGTSVMLISHTIGLVGYACDRVLVMHNGRIVEEADADKLLEHPRDAYTKKALIDAAPSLDAETASPIGKEECR